MPNVATYPVNAFVDVIIRQYSDFYGILLRWEATTGDDHADFCYEYKALAMHSDLDQAHRTAAAVAARLAEDEAAAEREARGEIE